MDPWKEFVKFCHKLNSPNELASMLELFLTHEEKKSLADRYLIVKALLQGTKTQREIAKEFNVSIAKITRGSNELKRISPELRKQLEAKLVK